MCCFIQFYIGIKVFSKCRKSYKSRKNGIPEFYIDLINLHQSPSILQSSSWVYKYHLYVYKSVCLMLQKSSCLHRILHISIVIWVSIAICDNSFEPFKSDHSEYLWFCLQILVPNITPALFLYCSKWEPVSRDLNKEICGRWLIYIKSYVILEESILFRIEQKNYQSREKTSHRQVST